MDRRARERWEAEAEVGYNKFSTPATHQRPRQAIVAEHMSTRRQAGVRRLGGAADAARASRRIHAAAYCAGGARSRQHLPGLSREPLHIKCHRHGIGEANQTCGRRHRRIMRGQELPLAARIVEGNEQKRFSPCHTSSCVSMSTLGGKAGGAKKTTTLEQNRR